MTFLKHTVWVSLTGLTGPQRSKEQKTLQPWMLTWDETDEQASITGQCQEEESEEREKGGRYHEAVKAKDTFENGS